MIYWGGGGSDICVYNVKKRSRKHLHREGRTIFFISAAARSKESRCQGPQEALLFGRRGDVCKVDEPGVYIALPIEGSCKTIVSRVFCCCCLFLIFNWLAPPGRWNHSSLDQELEAKAPTLEVKSLNHWTNREITLFLGHTTRLAGY